MHEMPRSPPPVAHYVPVIQATTIAQDSENLPLVLVPDVFYSL